MATKENIKTLMVPSSLKMVRRGYVYLFRAGEYHKIGFTFDVEVRRKALQAGNPHPIELVFAVEVSDTPFIEQQVHKILAPERVNGEWFKLTPPMVEVVKKFMNDVWKLTQEMVNNPESAALLSSKGSPKL